MESGEGGVWGREGSYSRMSIEIQKSLNYDNYMIMKLKCNCMHMLREGIIIIIVLYISLSMKMHLID